MKETLEKLTEGGWKKVGYFGDCEIYSKEEERILYNPKTEEIVMKLNYDEQNGKTKKM